MMLDLLNDYDWKEAFGYCGEPDTCTTEYKSGLSIRGAHPEREYDLSPFTRNDVVEILGHREGEGDGDEWLIYGVLSDGRYFYLEAGCDYTGWDCQADGSASIANSRTELERFGMPEESREVFGITLQDHPT